jgi:hypothetical protein
LPSFGRFLIRDGDTVAVAESNGNDDDDITTTDLSARTIYARDSG